MTRRIVCAALTVVLGSLVAVAAELPQVHALSGARIVVAPGEVIESGTVILRDGVIEAVGAAVEVPPDATVWEYEELTVYPGLIELYAVQARPDGDDDPARRQGGHPNRLVRPESDATSYAGQEETFRRLREVGFTSALIAPKEGLFRGRGVLANLGDGELGDNLLRRGGAQFVTLDASGGDSDYPQSTMGAVALFRQTLLDAAWYRDAQRAFARRPTQRRPPQSTALEALARVVTGDEVVVVETGDAIGSLRAIALVDELGLGAWLVGNGEEYKWLEAIAAAGLPHLLPIDLPDDPAGGEEDDLSVGLDELRHWDEAPSNPRRVLASGITVAMTSHGLAEPKSLHANLARAIDDGLTVEQALAALTTTPARLLGIADRAGSVTAGKMANLVVVEGELFTEETKIRELWIDGRRYEVKESKPPEVEPAGTWELVVETPDGQQIPIRLELAGAATSLTGSVVAQGQSVELDSAEVSGTEVEIAFDGSGFGMPGTIRFTLEIRGEEASGSGVSPDGPFTVSGDRTSGPGGTP